jgi:type IV secretion system protein TrbL
VKVLVLAVIVGIGSMLFAGFVSDLGGAQPTLDQVLAIALGALSLLGLGIFGPGIASGLVAGAPHLGAGAAVGTAMAVGGAAMAGAGVARSAAGAAGAAFQGGRAAASAVGRRSGGSGETGEGGDDGPQAGPSGGSRDGGDPPESPDNSTGGASEPSWAERLKARFNVRRGLRAAANALRAGDHRPTGASISLDEEQP